MISDLELWETNFLLFKVTLRNENTHLWEKVEHVIGLCLLGDHAWFPSFFTLKLWYTGWRRYITFLKNQGCHLLWQLCWLNCSLPRFAYRWLTQSTASLLSSCGTTLPESSHWWEHGDICRAHSPQGLWATTSCWTVLLVVPGETVYLVAVICLVEVLMTSGPLDHLKCRTPHAAWWTQFLADKSHSANLGKHLDVKLPAVFLTFWKYFWTLKEIFLTCATNLKF